MHRLGALPSAASFRLLVTIRNRIARSNPDDSELQSEVATPRHRSQPMEPLLMT
jgi:hypothetical protein